MTLRSGGLNRSASEENPDRIETSEIVTVILLTIQKYVFVINKQFNCQLFSSHFFVYSLISIYIEFVGYDSLFLNFDDYELFQCLSIDRRSSVPYLQSRRIRQQQNRRVLLISDYWLY